MAQAEVLVLVEGVAGLRGGEILELEVERIAPRGEGVARTEEGIVVFVANAAPGDRVRARITAKRRGAWRAEPVERLQEGPDAASPFCPHAHECGGCALQFVRKERWGHIKAEWVRQAFAQWWHEQLDWQDAALSGGLRRRVRWAVGEGKIGFRKRASHDLVAIERCPIVVPALEDLRRRLLVAGWARFAGEIQATVCDRGRLALAIGFAPPPVAGIECWQQALPQPKPIGDARFGLDRLPGGVEVEVGAEDFVQACREGEAAMIALLQRWLADARRIADLFCGTGRLSLPLAATGKEVIGADYAKAAIARANAAARRHRLPARYFVADLMRAFDPRPFASCDAWIVDPPRRGAERVCRHLGAALPEQLVLVHCDVASARRDAALVASFGYRLQALRAIDLFPGAGHVEAISLWRRA